MTLLLWLILGSAALSVLYMGRDKLVYLWMVLLQTVSFVTLVLRMLWTKLKIKVAAKWSKYRAYQRMRSVAREPVDPANKPAPNVVMKRPSQRIKVES